MTWKTENYRTFRTIVFVLRRLSQRLKFWML